MNNNKNIFLLVTIRNCISLICWTTLAIIFDKWWLTLFTLLFLTGYGKTVTTYKEYFRICDKCGTHSATAESPEKALEKAKEAGWLHIQVGDKWEDYCPKCR